MSERVDSSLILSFVAYILRMTDVGVKDGDNWGKTQTLVQMFLIAVKYNIFMLTMLVTALAGECLPPA